jgi:signal transduction histidine kinase
VAEERLRIARDLHDSVAHAMATINVQASAAAHVLARQPDAAAAALSVIARASADVLDELGSMLAVLRDGSERAERAPAPGLADIRRLADSVGPSGLAVDVQISESTQSTTPTQGTAAYRVVQESLTNVLRHSRAEHVQLSVASEQPGALSVEIRDPGPARNHDTAGSGVGIRGMRERVAATGGTFMAEPTAEGGFVVRAEWDGAE